MNILKAGDRLTSILVAILVFGLIVLIHEFGHFLLAKKNGIAVVEFSIGMGPRIWSFQKGETRYSLKILPLGGSCMMLGELEDNSDERSFQNKSIPARMAVIAAGPVFNFILAFVLGVILVGMGGYTTTAIRDVTLDSPAYEAGIRPGDTLTKINGENVRLYRDYVLYSVIHSDQIMDQVEYERTDPQTGEITVYTSQVTPEYSEEQGRYLIGISLSGENHPVSSVLELLKYGFMEVEYNIRMTIESLGMLLTGKAGVDDLSGPVGIVVMIDDSVQAGLSVSVGAAVMNVLSLCVLLSANLGVMNLIPIPALDGGRLVFLIIEALRGKPMDPEKEGMVNFVSMMALMALMLYVVFNDIQRFM
ncbi:MAG TPA: site-2 protease family protein [Candidatus Hungatella pullicola]|nr:site-2 protease family protein [Candidatus Hungatella pullicola]